MKRKRNNLAQTLVDSVIEAIKTDSLPVATHVMLTTLEPARLAASGWSPTFSKAEEMNEALRVLRASDGFCRDFTRNITWVASLIPWNAHPADAVALLDEAMKMIVENSNAPATGADAVVFDDIQIIQLARLSKTIRTIL